MNELMEISFVSSNYTWAYGAPGKRSFRQTHTELVELVTDVIKERFPDLTTGDVHGEFKNYFKYVVQTTNRIADKKMRKEKNN